MLKETLVTEIYYRSVKVGSKGNTHKHPLELELTDGADMLKELMVTESDYFKRDVGNRDRQPPYQWWVVRRNFPGRQRQKHLWVVVLMYGAGMVKDMLATESD